MLAAKIINTSRKEIGMKWSTKTDGMGSGR